MLVNKRVGLSGQFTVIGLMVVFVTLIVYVAIYPALNEIIQTNLSQFDPTTQLIIKLIPFFLLLAIILTVVFYVVPHREQVYERY